MPVAKLVSAGVDYLRITSADAQEQNKMQEFFRKVAKADEGLGYKVIKGGAFGFLGWKTRHALFGHKKEWSMLQVSGYEARSAWRLAREGTQCSRIDLQLTYWVGEEDVEKTVREAYNAACALQDAERRHMKVNMIESRHRAQTVYIGSRASDIFFRIYDKFEESGKEEYRGCVRFELELKGRMSKALWRRICAYEVDLRGCLEMVVAMLRQRGVAVPNADLDAQDTIHLKKENTSLESSIAWLSRQVAPTVRRITSEAGWFAPFSVLFAGACESSRYNAIMRALVQHWGS